MINLNKILITGRLTRTPEISYTDSGTALCKFSIAFEDGWGENKKTGFIDITAWAKTAEFIHKYFKKGTAIFVEGKLKFDTWDKDGKRMSKHGLTAESVDFVESLKSSDKQTESNPTPEKKSEEVAEFSSNPLDALDDEDIPF